LENITLLGAKDTWQSTDGIYFTAVELTAYNIPLLSSTTEYFDYELEGEIICDGHLGNFKYESTSDHPNISTSRILQYVICSGSDDGTPNRIYVKFK